MLVDDYEQYQNNDRTDVVVVSRSGSEEEPEPDPLATDRMSLPLPNRLIPMVAVRKDRSPSFPRHRTICIQDRLTISLIDAAIMARVLPKDPELETEAETHHTWHIRDWRKMGRKEHGPIFECGGSPWWVS